MALGADDAMVLPGATELDVGTGSGVLAVAAARLGAGRVVAVDIDPDAADVAQANAVRNGVDDRIDVVVGGLDAVGAGRPFDLVVANLSRLVLVELAEPIVAGLAPSGIASVTGLLDEQADDVAEAFGRAGAQVVGRQSTGGWTLVELRRAQATDAPGR
jgi:ribosomal protein L11 methyltransferase